MADNDMASISFAEVKGKYNQISPSPDGSGILLEDFCDVCSVVKIGQKI